MAKIFDFEQHDSYLYKLSGLTKLIGFITLTFTVMFSYDIRVILFILLFSILLFRISEIKLKQLKVILIYVSIFLIINFVLTFLFAPTYGESVYGTRHVLIDLGRYSITQEQLFYQTTKLFKYLSVIPLGILFLFTTNPSEFAASLNRIKVHYKAAYAFSLTLRYFPDVQREYMTISKAQQARGVDLSKKVPLRKRITFALITIIPLIFSTLDRIETISNGMDLRGFGRLKKRTWYEARVLTKNDWFSIISVLLIFAASISISIFINGSRFYNPFL